MNDDDDFAAGLRARVEDAPLTSLATPGEVRARARRAQRVRRVVTVTGSVGALAVGAALALPALGLDLPLRGPVGLAPAGLVSQHTGSPAETASDVSSPADAAPARETNGVRTCFNYSPTERGSVEGADEHGNPMTLGGLEGWWNSFPADLDGDVLPVEEWPQEILDHPVTAQVETRSGTVLETFDRRSCTSVPDYVPPPLDTLPAESIVVLDVETGEILAESTLLAPSP
ncbi:hypothetical protein ASE27_00835 [Oerskovia sp. Root918]|uniref:hypothetical protein n=1 Tax=unclassified Oerskovia TaxID=2619021 RepID=UPI000700F236|nr:MULTISPECIES: hypothetical protein [unclassified Oerskovia]KRC42863.1 hypothetical protein ASE15_02345 [Oerskovia sp. Root22]KRD47001.1 hypothetical protein ASE27_00835 [Oerskovia sp. Root918]